ncbi:MAG: methylated-DNA--[protein]-cysteine S-methyltransferase [Chlamydiae bacterium]|nr:methylated-DNA--[protein]-cysteine S-methyltransferase [Chlamydiota bacterium]
MKNIFVSIEELSDKKQPLYYGSHETSFGKVIVVSTIDAFVCLEFISPEYTQQDILKKYPEAIASEAITGTLLRNFFDKKPVTVLIEAGDFHKNVWKELIKIEEGSLVSYKDIADRIGRPKAMRAVGNAVGANPVSLVIPCHRVIRKNGEMGGYRWGLERKERLISWEKQNLHKGL